MVEFKPNIYPIIYWGLMYGVIAGLVLFAVYLLSRFITVVWFPVFLGGVLWGGFRNYQKQKKASVGQDGVPSVKKPIVNEFKEAASDIVSATREMMAEQPDDESGPDNPVR